MDPVCTSFRGLSNELSPELLSKRCRQTDRQTRRKVGHNCYHPLSPSLQDHDTLPQEGRGTVSEVGDCDDPGMAAPVLKWILVFSALHSRSSSFGVCPAARTPAGTYAGAPCPTPWVIINFIATCALFHLSVANAVDTGVRPRDQIPDP